MPPGYRQKLGTFGERVAIAHLEEKGYRIIETNFRVREGEIDIVAEHEDTLVFVEVKTRRGDSMGTAKESIGWRKAQSLLLAAQAYGQRHEDLPPGRRIDVIAIDLDPDGELLSVEHIESAVEES
jgi:putative endonuclease